jgi:hypothetical protein
VDELFSKLKSSEVDRGVRAKIENPTVRHGYPWVPTNQAHDRPRQVGPAY